MKRTAVVTGATSGIGLECAVQLAQRGMRVVVVGRDAGRGARALAAVRERGGGHDAVLELCEMSSLAEVRSLAERLLANNEHIDVLVNNAGLVSDRRRTSVDGHELTFAVNHLAPYLLTRLVLDRMRATAASSAQAHSDVRIVNVSSKSHYRGTMSFDDLMYERGYFILSAYERSKLANVLFTLELARRLDPSSKIAVQAVHPGRIESDIWRRAPWFARPLLALRKKDSAERGGARVVHAAIAPEARTTGGYWSDEKRVAPSKLARDEALARRLWDVSADLVGVSSSL